MRDLSGESPVPVIADFQHPHFHAPPRDDKHWPPAESFSRPAATVGAADPITAPTATPIGSQTIGAPGGTAIFARPPAAARCVQNDSRRSKKDR